MTDEARPIILKSADMSTSTHAQFIAHAMACKTQPVDYPFRLYPFQRQMLKQIEAMRSGATMYIKKGRIV